MSRILIAVCLLTTSLLAADYGKVTIEKVADGVYLFKTSGYGDVGLSGNSVAIFTDEGVALFDTTGLPSTGKVIVDEVRRLTDKPVRYVINSHWHWDHWGGNQVFKAAFPEVQIVSHAKTREMIATDAAEWNREYMGKLIPQHLTEVEQALAAEKAKPTKPGRDERLAALLAADKDFYEQKRTLTTTLPNAVFNDTMTLFVGGREIDLYHARAITPGDTYVFLPKERILITGDILVHPIPFAIGGTYPASWTATLRKLIALNPAIVVPGHGDVEPNLDFLKANSKLFERILADVKAARMQGMTYEQTRAALEKNAGDYAAMVGVKGDALDNFKDTFFMNFVRNAYEELERPLDDKPLH